MFTYDSIRDIKIYQHKDGYRFSIDALLLFSFVKLNYVASIVDLGAGSGIIGILLAKKYTNAEVYLIELQSALARLAERNVEVNSLSNRVSVLNLDMRSLLDPLYRKNLALNFKRFIELIGNFDLAVSNPPFRKIDTGRISNDDERAIARHEIKLNLHELINSASLLIKNYGRFYIIHLSERLPELFGLMRQYRLEPKRLRFIHSKINSEAKMVLIESVKSAKSGLKIEPPFFIYDDEKNYTQQARDLFKI